MQLNQLFAKRYLLKKLIGVGGYSQVWLAEDIKSANLDIAIKIFAPGQGLDDKGLELFSKEYSLVFNLNHKNLLIPKHFDDFEGSPYLVMQYCQQGSVYGKIGEMSEMDLAQFMQQSASALNYLHQQDPPIIHQDIKPDNFLIDNKGNYLLADFGISSKIRRALTKSIGAQASTGTLAYMPPEKFSADKQIIIAGDIFSLGVTMYELLTGELPFGDNGGLTLKAGADVPNLPKTFSPDLNHLLISCMAKDPWERPPAEQLVEAAVGFLQNGHWPSVDKVAPKPVPISPKETLPSSLGRKTQQIPQLEPLSKPQSEPVTVTQIVAKAKLNYPLIISIIIVGVVAVLSWPRNASDEEQLELARMDSIAIADSLAAMAQTEVPTMVFVKGGTFKMGREDGNANEKPIYSVTVSDFCIGKYEVTQKQWEFIMGNNPSYFSECDNCPVEQVSWNDVQEFIQKLNQKTGKAYRLPTEAEWEYAAKGGHRSSGCTYSGSNIVWNVAWYSGISESKTHPIGRKHANELGLFDMSGNVWEWCSDSYGASSSSTQPKTPKSTDSILYAIRGGGWRNDEKGCQTTFRSFEIPSCRLYSIGFRLATSI